MQPNLFDIVSANCSRQITQRYSTSFSLGIRLLAKRLHEPIYSIYGFVRLADEIVDTFHGPHQNEMFDEFRLATAQAIGRRISTNPVLHAFQEVVWKFQIDQSTIDIFLDSMATDLNRRNFDRSEFDRYILGSAEVVGLMCLSVFTDGNRNEYEFLKPYAMRLGAAFQKVNFLRDMCADYKDLGRLYFPDIDIDGFSDREKQQIELEIEEDFIVAMEGIKRLPGSARLGVYTACLYYKALFSKIRRTPAMVILNRRIRISNPRKLWLMFSGVLRYNIGL